MPDGRATTVSEVGLVHDYLLVMRGAERTFRAIASCWPDAPIYTLLYDAAALGGVLEGHDVRPSYLQRLPVRQRNFRRLMPLYPRAVERLPVGEHRLIVSSSSAFAHGVRAAPDAQHVCYCHTPFRYAWHERARALAEVPAAARPILRRALDRIRRWDVAAARRVTHYIANGRVTQGRIRECYGRDAVIVHPPVDVARFRVGVPEDFFLVVTELVPHKRVDVALEACRLAGQPVKVVGIGPDAERLRALHGDGAEFLGRIGDRELAELYPRARALIVPNTEEFGIAAVEAQAAGRPVVGAGAGGVLETVEDGETGVLVKPGSVAELAEALRHTDFEGFDSGRIAKHAHRFSTDAFRERLLAEIRRISASS